MKRCVAWSPSRCASGRSWRSEIRPGGDMDAQKSGRPFGPVAVVSRMFGSTPGCKARRSTAGTKQAGMTLTEFMIGIAIGLVLVMALATLFGASSFNFSEEERSARQIENGRYATEL